MIIDIGPILPRYIQKIIIIFPASDSVAVKSRDSPTVARALVVSKAISISEPPSTRFSKKVVIIKNVILTIVMASALWTVR